MSMLHEAPTPDGGVNRKAAYRDLLVHVQADPKAEPRLATAVALARSLNATLIGVGAETVDPVMFADPTGMAGGDLLVAYRQLVADNLQRAESVFRAKAAGVRSVWMAADNEPAVVMARASSGADLIIAGGATPGLVAPYRVADAAELMLKSGRPVLIVPPEGGHLNATAVVVAWKDTREARRALADSLPFLQAAELVLVLEVCADERETPDAEARTSAVVEHLRRHDVAARAKVSVAPAYRVTEEIQRSARLIDADLIVMGGYGHSRFGEWVFGGVTRELARAQGHFVLVSH